MCEELSDVTGSGKEKDVSSCGLDADISVILVRTASIVLVLLSWVTALSSYKTWSLV